jgi:hypothetical protein
MINTSEILTNYFLQDLKNRYLQVYGNSKSEEIELLECHACIALEIIAKGFALYNNFEHTILATSVGQEILQSKQDCEGTVSSQDWLNFVISMLFHDIGYVKGICQKDSESKNLYTTGIGDEMVFVPPDGTDAHLIHYHVDRTKVFIDETFKQGSSVINPETLKLNVEFTRTPISKKEEYQSTTSFPGLFRAADLISQLSDPHYLDKTVAVFYEFEEIGENKKTGFSKPRDLRWNCSNFYWNTAFPYIKDALHYLELTKEGQKIIKSLYRNVFTVELEIQLGYANEEILSRLTQSTNLDKLSQISQFIRQSKTTDDVEKFSLSL